MKKFAKAYILTVTIFIILLTTIISYYQQKIVKIKNTNQISMTKLNDTYKEQILKLRTYEYLYKENKKDFDKLENDYKTLKKEYSDFKKNIAYVKSKKQYSRGISNDLTKFNPITTQELNGWIKQKAPANSPFIGKGDMFIKASHESGLDPKYIVAHAALESGWGTSKISKTKNNYFGIGSFNNTPYDSSHRFYGIEQGIIEGSKWIADNYINKGQNTLEKMIFGAKAYCETDTGLPDSRWIYKINSIMTR